MGQVKERELEVPLLRMHGLSSILLSKTESLLGDLGVRMGTVIQVSFKLLQLSV